MFRSELHNYYTRSHARVLGCLNSGEITVILAPGHGIFLPARIPVGLIPIDLRMPNSEFDILMKFPGGERIRALRKDEACLEIDRNRSI
ncbi:hypothetical protein [Chamaesiphon sp.]|uniref:hypothetical protein n=1 Tax=Chamaesiphon sp. TaxID=2814140 RepID=UPI0035940B42